MNSFFSGIIEFFKNLFGIKPERKTNEEIASDFHDTRMSITGVIAERLTTLALADSSIEVVGDGARAKFLNIFMQWFYKSKLTAVGNVCLGTGDVLARPNTDGKRIGIDLIENQNFVIVDSVGDFLYSVLIKCDEVKKDNNIYERWEYHKLNTTADGVSYVSITQVAFKNGKQTPIGDVPAWANIKENQIIPNVDRLLFGRFKCPKINKNDINSANGVPITAGNEYIVAEAKKSYERYNQEFDASKKFIFADKRVFKTQKRKNKDGNTVEVTKLPEDKKNVIMTVNGSTQVDGSPLIHEFNPEIRQADLDAGIERNFRMLELFCGLSEGILSKSTLTYTNTDEVKKSTQATFAFITNFRNVLENGLNDLIYAINIICNFNELTPMGDYDINFDWSDSYVESMAERFNELLQARNMEVISKAEFRSWVMSEPLELAEKQIAEIDSEELLNDDLTSAKDTEEIE
jgi:A118 family predicted phage portal protein